MSDFNLIPYTPPVTAASPLPPIAPLPGSIGLPISQIQNIALPPVSSAPPLTVFQRNMPHGLFTIDESPLKFPAERPEIIGILGRNLTAIYDVRMSPHFLQPQVISEDVPDRASSSLIPDYQAPSTAGRYLSSCERIAESIHNQSDQSQFPLYHRSATICRGLPPHRNVDRNIISSTTDPQINPRKRTARDAGMDRDLNTIVRQREKLAAENKGTISRECCDEKQCLNALKALRANLHLTSSQPSSSESLDKAREITDDLIEFPEMITQSDRFFYAGTGREVTEVLAANKCHPRYNVPLIQYLVVIQQPPQLPEMAINQLRSNDNQAVWIDTEGTNLSREQLEAYGFHDAEDKQFMALGEANTARVKHLAHDEGVQESGAEEQPLLNIDMDIDADSDTEPH